MRVEYQLTPDDLFTFFPIVAALNWVIHRWLLRRAIRALVAQEMPEKGRLGRHEIELGGEGLVERTAVGEVRTSWSGVHRLEQDNRYIYLYTQSSHQRFLNRVRTRW